MVFLIGLACAPLCSSGKSEFGGGSQTRRSAAPSTVSVGAEGRELTCRRTKDCVLKAGPPKVSSVLEAMTI